MTKGAYRIRFLGAYICSVIVVYLLWIGSQYVIKGNVVLDYVDNAIAIALAWYIARDIMTIDSRLRWAEEQQRYQQRRR